MPIREEFYTGADPNSPYYSAGTATSALRGAGEDPRLQTVSLPAGWLVQSWSGWEGWTPRDWAPRVQGWKIHLSATPEQAPHTLAITSAICIAHQVAFKFLPTRSELIGSSTKQGDRGGAGKFITIYPDHDEQFAELVAELDGALAGTPGPYILSDLRVNDGPVYVRYGGILPLELPGTDDRGISAIARPGTMTLIPDLRAPRFVVPDGVEVPAVLHPSLERSRQSSPSRLAEFTSIKPLHFSNAGGVYRATLPDGAVRVLREARPHAGLDARGRCALTRQKVEEEVLIDLVGVEGVQQLRSVFTAWEHRYLELDYVEGGTLTAWAVRHIDQPSLDPVGYARRTQKIGAQLIDIVQRVHDHGWAVGDLHTGNVLVDDEDRVTLLDLEDATRIGAPREVGFRVMEFCADDGLSAAEADWFAVARCLMLLYVPDWEIEAVAPTYWATAMAKVRAQFGEEAARQLAGVTERYPSGARPVLASRAGVSVPDATPPAAEVIARLDAGIAWSQRFSPHGAYPGDVTQPGRTSHEVLASGRAGVVSARKRMGLPVPGADLTALAAVARAWAPGENPGLANGLAGLALVLAEAGRDADGLEVAVPAARMALEQSLGRRRLDLAGGQTGTILVALEVGRAAADEQLVADALAGYERLHQTVRPDTTAWTSLTTRRGYLWGLTGLALLDLAAHQATGEDEQLERAIGRLRLETDACIELSGGELMVRDDQNNRVLPYIEWGGAGVWLITTVAERLAGRRLLSDRERQGFAATCSSDFYIYPGLDHGRAGIVVALVAGGPEHAAEAERQSLLLRESLLGDAEMVFSIGDGLIRLSSDLSTGAAGVALGLHSQLSGQPYLMLPVAETTARAWGELAVPVLDPVLAGSR